MTAQYCTPQNVRDVLRGTDPAGAGTAAELNDAQIQKAIIDASGMVSSYAGTTWETDQWNPVVVVPPMVKSLTERLAAYYATLFYRGGKNLDNTDPVYLMYLDVRATFADIVSGKIEVNPGRPNEAPEHRGVVRNTIPGIFSPRDSGTKMGPGGRVVPSGSGAWGGYMPNPWAGYDQG